MFGNPTNMNFMDQYIIDEQTVLELARDQYSCDDHIPDAVTHIVSDLNSHENRTRVSIRSEGYECFMTSKEKETD